MATIGAILFTGYRADSRIRIAPFALTGAIDRTYGDWASFRLK